MLYKMLHALQDQIFKFDAAQNFNYFVGAVTGCDSQLFNEIKYFSFKFDVAKNGFVGAVKAWDSHCDWDSDPSQPSQCCISSEVWIHTGK